MFLKVLILCLPIKCRLLNFSSATNFLGASDSFKIGENTILVSNSLYPAEAPSYSASVRDQSCLNVASRFGSAGLRSISAHAQNLVCFIVKTNVNLVSNSLNPASLPDPTTVAISRRIDKISCNCSMKFKIRMQLINVLQMSWVGISKSLYNLVNFVAVQIYLKRIYFMLFQFIITKWLPL